MKRILIVDTDTYICNLLRSFLKEEGYEADIAFSGNSAKKKLISKKFNLILCDYRLPDTNDFELVEFIKKQNRNSTIIIMTAYAEIRTAVRAIKMGAFDYVSKPIYPDEIKNIVNKALGKIISQSSDGSKAKYQFNRDFVIGKNKQMIEVLDYLKVVAPTNMTVLIEGETGSGKEYIARAIHLKSKRKKNPFIPVDCGAIPKELASSELFGHIKGAFTGAIRNKRGYFERANKGTLFLDEIGNLQPDIQVKLLRAIQEKIINRLGTEVPVPVDVRIIVATNEDLKEQVNKGSFREDLFHRINAFRIYIPPLRERKDDMELFVNHFISKANNEFQKRIEGVSADFLVSIQNYSWPGNIRELENIIRRCVLLESGKSLSVSSLPEEILYSWDEDPEKNGRLHQTDDLKLKTAASMAEKNAIIEALRKTGNNKTDAARLLNIDRKTLYNKLKKYSIHT